MGRSVIEVDRKLSDNIGIKWKLPTDILFIDGDHRYEGVKRDWDLFSPYVATFGLVVHDTLWDVKPDPRYARADMGVPRFAEKLRQQGYPLITLDKDFGVTLVQPTREGIPLSKLWSSRSICRQGLMSKLRVLLVADFLSWILGTWAKQIVRIGTMHDYYLFAQDMLPQYSDEWERLIHNVDVVHFLNQHDIEKMPVPTELPIINSITHVVHWEELRPLTQADAVVVIAEEWKAFLQAKGVPPEQIWLFNIGVNTAQFYPFENKSLARKQLGIRSNASLIGYSAKFTSDYGGRKGIDIFLQALKIAAAAGHTFGVVITGPGWDTVVRQIESCGIEVHYRPFLPDRLMPTFYNTLDLYVVTSRIEGGPAPLIESMACGVPVVTTPVGIARDYIQDGVNGLVVPKDDAPACAQSILRLLASTELCCQLANAGLQTVETHLTWDKTLVGIEQLYEYVCQAKAGITKRAESIAAMNPATQKNWAISVDAHRWHQGLYREGHRREGLRGMLENIFQVKSETPILLRQTFSTIRPKPFRKLHKIL